MKGLEILDQISDFKFSKRTSSCAPNL